MKLCLCSGFNVLPGLSVSEFKLYFDEKEIEAFHCKFQTSVNDIFFYLIGCMNFLSFFLSSFLSFIVFFFKGYTIDDFNEYVDDDTVKKIGEQKKRCSEI